MPAAKKKAADQNAPEPGMSEAWQKQDEDEGWEEIESDFVTFTDIGDSVAGRLIDKSTQEMRNGTVGRYQVEIADGTNKTFLGGTDLDAKLKLIEVGTQIKVRFIGTQSTNSGQQMKRFQVLTR